MASGDDVSELVALVSYLPNPEGNTPEVAALASYSIKVGTASEVAALVSYIPTIAGNAAEVIVLVSYQPGIFDEIGIIGSANVDRDLIGNSMRRRKMNTEPPPLPWWLQP